MLGDLRDWLAGFDAPAEARPLAPETEAVNRRQLRRSWVDVSYRSAMAPTDALRAIGGTDEAWWKPTGLGELSGADGAYLLRLAAAPRRFPLGLNAVGRVRPDPQGGSIVEAQIGRSGGDLPVFVVPALAAYAAVSAGIQALTGGPVSGGWLLVVPLAMAAFAAARVFGPDAEVALDVLHERVPPLVDQPLPLPVCGPGASAGPGEVRRALTAALARPTRVVVDTRLAPDEVRDALRARIGSADRRPVVAPWRAVPLKGRVTRRRIDVYVPGSGSGEELGSTHLTGSISRAERGSTLVLRCGRSSGAVWGLLGFAVLCLLGAVGCWIAAVVEQDSSWVGGGLLFALFGVAFIAAVIGTGWQADGRPDPLATVVEAVEGTVRPSDRHPAPPPPPRPPLVSPYRR